MMDATRRGVVSGLAAAALAGCATRQEPPAGVDLSGHAVQGGSLIGRTVPGARLRFDGQDIGYASSRGLFIIGFDRDAAPEATLQIEDRTLSLRRSLAIAPGDLTRTR